MRRVKSLLVVIVMLGCGGAEITEPEGELVLTPPPEPLTGTVLAADTFVVSATDVNFTVQPFSNGGTLPANIESAVGKLFIFSLRDISRPDVVCTGLALSNQLCHSRRLWRQWPCGCGAGVRTAHLALAVDLRSG